MKTLGECVGFARIGNGIPSTSTQMNLPLIKKNNKKEDTKRSKHANLLLLLRKLLCCVIHPLCIYFWPGILVTVTVWEKLQIASRTHP